MSRSKRGISGDQSSSGGHGWDLQSVLRFSIFAFADPELEALFQSYESKQLSAWMLVNTGTIITGWLLFVIKVSKATEQSGFSPSPALYGVGLLHVLVLTAHLCAILLKPVFYAKHQRTIKSLLMACLMFSCSYAWETLFWIKFVSAKRGAPRLSWLQGLQLFASENPLVSTMWILALGFTSGQVPDLAIITGSLMLYFISTRSFCESPLWGQSLVSMSPAYLAAAHMASLGVASVGGPYVSGYTPGHVMSCPAVLGFWALVGWWVACLAGLVAEVLRRRAFLQTHEALSFLGPAYAAAALQWPFASSEKIMRCIMIFCLLSYSASLIWNTALLFLG
eukprot:jgi/Botrbrau1/15675/Bobra.4_1s0055.3